MPLRLEGSFKPVEQVIEGIAEGLEFVIGSK
jgi:hypothetical protein